MDGVRERLAIAMTAARIRGLSRIRSAFFIAILLIALLWFTQWPSLRAGLLLLLAGQFAIVVLTLWRNRQIEKEGRALSELALQTDDLPAWFDEELRSVALVASCEAGLRTLGFLVLAFGFWKATGNATLSLVLGVGYPAITFFTMDRRKQLAAQHRLRAEKASVEAMLRRQS